MLIRGLLIKTSFKSATSPLFIGKNVKFRNKRNITFGRSVTINANCYIDALSKKGVVIGDAFSLGRNSVIECTGVLQLIGEGIIIGNNVGISANAFISVRGYIKIGDNTIIGPSVAIIAENHSFETFETPIRLQKVIRKGIEIGENCWIGANVVILDGVKIGNDSVIAAGAVVTHDVPNSAIFGGVPAKLIRMRKPLI